MRNFFITMLGCLGFLVAGSMVHGQSTNSDPAFALVILYDASGSMNDTVKGADGKPAKKYQIANQAVVAIANKLKDFCDGKPTNIDAGLVVFSNSDARPAIPLGTFNAAAFKSWAQSFHSPDGGTPLGEAIKQANSMLAQSKSFKKHILIVTDGESNVGAKPQAVLADMQKNKDMTSIYFVAFDVADKVFEPVKALGATVVSASNESELRAQLDMIVGKKILLEAE